MVSLRGLAFALGAVGLALFLGGILWALLAPAHPSCAEFRASPDCKAGYESLLNGVMLVIGAGLVVEAAAVVILLVHLAGRKPPGRTAPQGKPPAKPATTKPATRPPGPGLAGATARTAPQNGLTSPGRNGPR
jgi:hypothetical protein